MRLFYERGYAVKIYTTRWGQLVVCVALLVALAFVLLPSTTAKAQSSTTGPLHIGSTVTGPDGYVGQVYADSSGGFWLDITPPNAWPMEPQPVLVDPQGNVTDKNGVPLGQIGQTVIGPYGSGGYVYTDPTGREWLEVTPKGAFPVEPRPVFVDTQGNVIGLDGTSYGHLEEHWTVPQGNVTDDPPLPPGGHTQERPSTGNPLAVPSADNESLIGADTPPDFSDEDEACFRFGVMPQIADEKPWDGVYDPNGESSHIKDVQDDRAMLEAQGNQTGVLRRDWELEIYHTAYTHARNIGLDNLTAHAYAQIQLDEWSNGNVGQFVDTGCQQLRMFAEAFEGIHAIGNFFGALQNALK